MSSRGRTLTGYEERSISAPALIPPVFFSTHHQEGVSDRVHKKEIGQLVTDNRKLAAAHVTLREELASVQEEIERTKGYIQSIESESDIQVRVLLNKIATMEADILAGDTVTQNLQNAHVEAHTLAKAREELLREIERASDELHKVNTDVVKLPHLHTELDSLIQEHQRLRAKFEYEKSTNMEQVKMMQAMEKRMVAMAREVERLRGEVSNVENGRSVPNYLPITGEQAVPFMG